MAHQHDIAVLGATPAGYAAAHYLAAKGCDVVVLDAPQEAVECPLLDWVPKDFFSLSGLPKTLAARSGAKAFKRVIYHNSRLDKDAEFASRGAAGYFVDKPDLVKALKAAATAAGAKNRTTTTAPAIRLEEELVRLIGTVQVQARLLIVAQNQPSDILSDLGLPVRTMPRSSLTSAALDVPLADKQALPAPNILHVVELPEQSELGVFFAAEGRLHLRLISSSIASGNRAAELSAMVNDLQQAGIISGKLQLSRSRGAVWRPPAGVALEMETHVAKRCILTGTAGGFAESITGQTLMPSVHSALLAAQAALEALDSPDPQNMLMEYKSSWRKTLADKIRPPNTSLHLLLPLLFANLKIVSKFTHALLYGENI